MITVNLCTFLRSEPRLGPSPLPPLHTSSVLSLPADARTPGLGDDNHEDHSQTPLHRSASLCANYSFDSLHFPNPAPPSPLQFCLLSPKSLHRLSPFVFRCCSTLNTSPTLNSPQHKPPTSHPGSCRGTRRSRGSNRQPLPPAAINVLLLLLLHCYRPRPVRRLFSSLHFALQPLPPLPVSISPPRLLRKIRRHPRTRRPQKTPSHPISTRCRRIRYPQTFPRALRRRPRRPRSIRRSSGGTALGRTQSGRAGWGGRILRARERDGRCGRCWRLV